MTTVLISGAGIAGPSLAFWLSRYGYEVTVVKQADGLREGGSAVDFRGDQMALLVRMGILDELRACAPEMGDQLIVDRAGRAVSRVPSVIFSGELEIERGDLSRVLHRHIADHVEYVFGDRVYRLLSSRPMTGLLNRLVKKNADTGALREYVVPGQVGAGA